MGTAIALRLLERGHQVTVWNRTLSKTVTAARAGASVAASPAALAATTDSIITILTNATALQAVYTGVDGLLCVDVRNKMFIEMSTVRGADHRALAPRVDVKGAYFIECPVSGTVQPAREGKLVGFAGGTPVAFAKAQPLLQQLCRRVDLIGPMGAGANMKLAANLLLTVFWQALAEACGLMCEMPMSPERLIELLADSNVGAGILKARGALVAAAMKGDPPPGPASFDIDFMRKDLREMLEDAEAMGTRLPVAAETLACFDEAAAAGAGKIDATQYPAWWLDSVRCEPQPS
jgi:3-hydroxyisobutyrate dehydrogenase